MRTGQDLRVLVAVGRPLLQEGIKIALRRMPGICLVGETATATGALRSLPTSRPHVLLLGHDIAQSAGRQIVERIASNYPGVRVLLFCCDMTDWAVLLAMELGAAGCVHTASSPSELERALREVVRGRSWYKSRSARRSRANLRRLERLSGRQRQVLRMIAEGRFTKEIARRLGISSKTVETHRAQLMERLGIYTVAGLTRFALRTGIAPL